QSWKRVTEQKFHT
ncbi:saccharopine dehydrogenase family protein, partial [Vibrio parahaemolyticus V-223/04]